MALVFLAVACQPGKPNGAWNRGQPVAISVTGGRDAAVSFVAKADGGAWALVNEVGETVAPYSRHTFVESRDSSMRLVESFGSGGRLRVDDLPRPTDAYGRPSLAAGPGGSVFLIRSFTGAFGDGYDGVEIRRILADGTFDQTYGGDGSFLQMGASTSPFATPIRHAVGADGRIVLVRSALASTEQYVVQQHLWRVTSAGQLDPTFGTGGTVTVASSTPSAFTVVDGLPVLAVGDRLTWFNAAGVVSATTQVPGVSAFGQLVRAGSAVVAVAQPSGGAATLARFYATGGLDPSFDGDGIRPVSAPYGAPLPSPLYLADIAVDAAGGFVLPFVTSTGARVVRLSGNGAYDGTWGVNGGIRLDGSTASLPPRARFGHPDQTAAERRYPGATALGAGVVLPTAVPESRSVQLTAYGADGRLRSEVGLAGTVTFDGITSRTATVRHLVATPDGGTVSALVVEPGTGGALVKHTAAGVLDQSFGNGGASIQFGSRPTSLARQPDGGFVVGLRGPGPAVVRFTATGQLDETYGDQGRAAIPLPVFSGYQPEWTTVARPTADGGTVVLMTAATRPVFLQLIDVGGRPAPTGIAFSGSRDDGADLVVDAIGRILVATTTGTGTDSTIEVRRFSATLGADFGFGIGGVDVVQDPLLGHQVLRRVLVDSEQRIVLGAGLRTSETEATSAIIRRLPSGGVDGSYGRGGSVTFERELGDLALDSADRAVASSVGISGQVRRFSVGGVLEPGFGTAGVAEQPPFAIERYSALYDDHPPTGAIATTGAGPIFVAGTAGGPVIASFQSA